MISEIRINDMDDLIKSLNELPNHYIYRGQADFNWKLESTLERALGNKWSKEMAALSRLVWLTSAGSCSG